MPKFKNSNATFWVIFKQCAKSLFQIFEFSPQNKEENWGTLPYGVLDLEHDKLEKNMSHSNPIRFTLLYAGQIAKIGCVTFRNVLCFFPSFEIKLQDWHFYDLSWAYTHQNNGLTVEVKSESPRPHCLASCPKMGHNLDGKLDFNEALFWLLEHFSLK